MLSRVSRTQGRSIRTPSVEVRPARKGDMGDIRRLIRLFPQLFGPAKSSARGVSFFVASVDGRLVRLLCPSRSTSKRLGEVRSLAVHPDFQDRGVASKLVTCCVERARERGVRELFAVTSQTSFFGRLGFATFRREKTAMFHELAPRSPSN